MRKALGPGGAVFIQTVSKRAYVEARYAWNQRSEASLTKAIDGFQRAVSLDPDFARLSGLTDQSNIAKSELRRARRPALTAMPCSSRKARI